MIPYTCFISINAASRQRVNLNLGFVDINGTDLRLQPGNASASVVSCDVNDTIVSCTVSVAAAGEPSGINCSVFMDVPRAKSVYESVKCLRSGDGKTHIYYCAVTTQRLVIVVKLRVSCLMRLLLFSVTSHCCLLALNECPRPSASSQV